jgi:hypothetical protein
MNIRKNGHFEKMHRTKDRKKQSYKPLIHAYVHWLADVHSAVFEPAFLFVVPQQQMLPQTANDTTKLSLY